MDVNLDNVVVTNNKAEQRYEAQIGEYLAIIEYQQSGNEIIFIHTEVPEALEGHGVANKLARTVLEDARAEQLSVIPLCPFVASYIRRHREYLDLVAPNYRERLMRG